MNSNEIWIALIGAASGLITALGLNKIVPAILVWLEEWRERKRELSQADKNKLIEITRKVEKLERDIDEYRSFKVRTETAFQTLLPVIREIMRDHPTHIALFDQLKNIIFEEAQTTPTDGTDNIH